MYVLIVGCGNVGFYLAKALMAANHEVMTVECDTARYNFLKSELGDQVTLGRGDEYRVLEMVGAARCEVVVACTGDDEDNLIICQMAKKYFGVIRTLARVNDPRNEEIFQKLGIDAAVSSTRIIYQLIEQEISVDDIIPLAALKRGDLEIVDIEISEMSPVLGKSLSDLTLPGEALIISIIRKDAAMLAHGTTVLEQGDSVIALVRHSVEARVREFFAPGYSA